MPINDPKISPLQADNVKEKKTTVTRKISWPGIVAVLSLWLVIAAIGVAYYVYQKDTQAWQLLAEKQTVDIERKLAETQKIVIAQEKTFADMQAELKSYQRGEKNGDEYLNEAEHLVRLAMFMLIFEGDTTTVYQLLQAADEKIQIMGDSILTWPIRQSLAKDIVAVQVAHRVDLSGLISHLNALSAQVESLSRSFEPTEALASSASPTEPAGEKNTVMWKEKLNQTGSRIIQILGNLFIISRDAPKAAPLLPPDQYVYVIINIQTQLAMAQWAVLYRQPEIYQQSLTQADTWTRRYFAEDHSDTQAFLKGLNALLEIPIKPNLPDLTDSLRQIELARKKEQVVRPSNSKEKPKAEIMRPEPEKVSPQAEPTEKVRQHIEQVRQQVEQRELTEKVRQQHKDADGLGI
jgi:uroporphyrin-3 C-methyltransferase